MWGIKELSHAKFKEDANIHYRVQDIDKIDKELLSEIIQHFIKNQVPRLKTLQDYYLGRNVGILKGKRRREDHLADNRATHNFAKYVSQFIQGYMAGVPLKTAYQDDEEVEERLRDINRLNDADEHNSDLVLDQSIYGRAFELLYRNNKDETRFTTLDTLNTFVIYDETVEMKPLLGVRLIKNQFTDERYVHTYSENKKYIYKYDGLELELEDEDDHAFGGVPIIEYQNDFYRQGDFEDVLNLIDLYDAAQSDTANYMQDLNDAMLVIKGNLEINLDDAQDMKEKNLLMLQTELDGDGKATSADADYIYKEYDVAGTEAYKNRVLNNILLFTAIPNLLDEKGTTAQSGTALKMKLFALAQKRATKERMFKKSLRDRYRLINNISTVASEFEFDVNNILITFTENLPAMVEQEMKWFTDAGGELSQKTLISQLSFVENADEEIEQLKEESPQERAARDAYEFPKGDEDEEVQEKTGSD